MPSRVRIGGQKALVAPLTWSFIKELGPKWILTCTAVILCQFSSWDTGGQAHHDKDVHRALGKRQDDWWPDELTIEAPDMDFTLPAYFWHPVFMFGVFFYLRLGLDLGACVWVCCLRPRMPPTRRPSWCSRLFFPAASAIYVHHDMVFDIGANDVYYALMIGPFFTLVCWSVDDGRIDFSASGLKAAKREDRRKRNKARAKKRKRNAARAKRREELDSDDSDNVSSDEAVSSDSESSSEDEDDKDKDKDGSDDDKDNSDDEAEKKKAKKAQKEAKRIANMTPKEKRQHEKLERLRKKLKAQVIKQENVMKRGYRPNGDKARNAACMRRAIPALRAIQQQAVTAKLPDVAEMAEKSAEKWLKKTGIEVVETALDRFRGAVRKVQVVRYLSPAYDASRAKRIEIARKKAKKAAKKREKKKKKERRATIAALGDDAAKATAEGGGDGGGGGGGGGGSTTKKRKRKGRRKSLPNASAEAVEARKSLVRKCSAKWRKKARQRRASVGGGDDLDDMARAAQEAEDERAREKRRKARRKSVDMKAKKKKDKKKDKKKKRRRSGRQNTKVRPSPSALQGSKPGGLAAKMSFRVHNFDSGEFG